MGQIALTLAWTNYAVRDKCNEICQGKKLLCREKQNIRIKQCRDNSHKMVGNDRNTSWEMMFNSRDPNSRVIRSRGTESLL